MKILFDTNTLLPGFRHEGVSDKLIGIVINNGHTPVLTDYIIDELRLNIEKKFSGRQKAIALDVLLQLLGLGVIEVLNWDDYKLHIGDAINLVEAKDAPVIAAVMRTDIDYLVTRDEKHLLGNPKLSQAGLDKKVVSPDALIELL